MTIFFIFGAMLALVADIIALAAHSDAAIYTGAAVLGFSGMAVVSSIIDLVMRR